MTFAGQFERALDTWMCSEVVPELCLNHRKGGVSGTYDRAERLEPRYGTFVA